MPEHDDDLRDSRPPAASRAVSGKAAKPTRVPRTREGFGDELEVASDPNAELRAPLTAFIVLVPIALLGELYRFVGRPAGSEASQLFADPMLAATGAVLGLMPPLVPLAVLALGCLVVQLAQNRQWRLPTARLLGVALAWAAAWGAARVALALAARGLAVRASPDQIVEQIGLGISGALQEELLFRGGVLGLLLVCARLYGLSWRAGAFIAIPLSAVFFSLAHTDIVNHTAGAEAFAWSPFVERALAGGLYGLVFVRQGLAVCTLAHAGYNIAWFWLG